MKSWVPEPGKAVEDEAPFPLSLLPVLRGEVDPVDVSEVLWLADTLEPEALGGSLVEIPPDTFEAEVVSETLVEVLVEAEELLEALVEAPESLVEALADADPLSEELADAPQDNDNSSSSWTFA